MPPVTQHQHQNNDGALEGLGGGEGDGHFGFEGSEGGVEEAEKEGRGDGAEGGQAGEEGDGDCREAVGAVAAGEEELEGESASGFDAAGETGEGAAEEEGKECDARDVDAGEAGGDGIFADDAEAETKDGLTQHKCQEDGGGEGDEKAHVEIGLDKRGEAGGGRKLIALGDGELAVQGAAQGVEQERAGDEVQEECAENDRDMAVAIEGGGDSGE